MIDFADDARRELLALPREVRDSFFDKFPALAAHPIQSTLDLDVQNLHDPRGRRTRYWRLKVPGGYRAIYRVIHGRVHIDAIRPRPGVYSWLYKVLSRG
ncbi:MAG: type II toxin-antitoxin system RelE/ParE family toxin [Thermoplasmata archaeon]|nr:type II toxin-antitoxin system RelE/ParE family toxin [Thermoplasmata archaeon]